MQLNVRKLAAAHRDAWTLTYKFNDLTAAQQESECKAVRAVLRELARQVREERGVEPDKKQAPWIHALELEIAGGPENDSRRMRNMIENALDALEDPEQTVATARRWLRAAIGETSPPTG